MHYSRLFSLALIGFFLVSQSTPSNAAPLVDKEANTLALAYIEADIDDRQVTYQLALAQLRLIQVSATPRLTNH
jgi:hypothetical protein